MGKKFNRSDSGLLVPEAATIESITHYDKKNGTYRIGHDGSMGPLERGAFARDVVGPEIRGRRWTPTRVQGDTGGLNVMSVGEMEERLVQQFLSEEVILDLERPVSEMITTSQGAMDLLEKVRIDIQVGLADVPLLYQPLFERVDGPFPGGAVQIGGDVLFDANVVFFQKFEAGEIVFGTLARSGAPSFVPINTFAAGFEWTEDMIEFDRSYEIGMNSRAFGRAYNYLLNHMHLSPILSFAYAGANQTAANATAGEGITPHTLRTFQAAYRKGALAAIQRVPTWILANEADRFQIEDALLTPVLDANGNQLRRVPIEGIIYYNGATVNNGVKSYVYPGVTAGKCYFISPRLRMRELVHHDLRVDIGPADISRLIEGQQVARTRRGLYLDIANSVEEVTLPTS